MNPSFEDPRLNAILTKIDAGELARWEPFRAIM